ncbi:GGDEF domain-containing protein [Kineococcus sp. NPDC059986]|uniref:GGDEF domain-containing protein n=1 Tax=Kineococcus sp. NPDC059986 TaxID=3155538 RepID=UPI003450401F
MTRTPGNRPASLVSFSERVAWVLLVRLVVVALPVAAFWLLPSERTAPWSHVVVPALVTGGVAAVTSWSRLPRRAAITLPGAGLLVDGLYLGWVLHCLHGLLGPVPRIAVVYVLAITLLASFRTGVKVTLWHSLVLVLVFEFEKVGFLPVTSAAGVGHLRWHLLSLWVLVVTVAGFAAANERELRRRRYDADLLRRFGVEAERCTAGTEVAAMLAVLGRDELLARRCAVLLVDEEAQQGSTTVRATCLVADEAGVRDSRWSGEVDADSALGRVLAGEAPQLRTAVDDPVLATLLPRAGRVVLVAAAVPGSATVVLVLEDPGARRRLRPRGVPQRLLTTAERAAAQTSSTVARTRLVERLRTAASTDGLTGVANRRALDEALAAAVEDARRSGGNLSVLLLDLDHFKALNDTHGHEAGDDALRAVGALLRTELPVGAFAARYGGEEFCVVLPGTVDGGGSADTLRQRVRTLDVPGPLTVSVGVATLPAHGVSARDLLSAADSALYEAKRSGRDRVVLARHRDGSESLVAR